MSEQKNLTEKKEEATAGSSTTNVQPDKKPLPKLGALEDDDEFEVCSEVRFQVWVMLIEPSRTFLPQVHTGWLAYCWLCWLSCADYEGNIQDSLKKAAAGPSDSDNLWEDNWDDDDVDDDFTKQLRCVVYYWNNVSGLTVYRTAIQERANAPADETMKE